LSRRSPHRRVIFGGSNSKERLKINPSDNEREVLWRRLSLGLWIWLSA
jgi:hypothetical protein